MLNYENESNIQLLTVSLMVCYFQIETDTVTLRMPTPQIVPYQNTATPEIVPYQHTALTAYARVLNVGFDPSRPHAGAG